jgi:cysteine desulfurase family protein
VKRIYLDNAATTFPKPPEVLAAMMQYATELGASAGRGAYHEAVQTGTMIAQCRQRLAQLFHGESSQHFIFTLNCSDALNLAIKGLAHPQRKGHAICTQADHNSILRPLNALAQQGCIEPTRVPVDPKTGVVDPADIERAIRPDTRFIAIAHASNVTGTVQPIRQIGQIARRRQIPFIVDAAQSAGHIPVDVQADGIDLLAAPGHKGLMGPLGTGFLYIRPGIEKVLRTLREGGTGSISEQDVQPDFLPDKYEPGSHNAIGIIGLGAGVQWVLSQGIEKLAADEAKLSRAFIDAIDGVAGLRLYGPRQVKQRVGVFSIAMDGLEPQELSAVLESHYGILSRSGFHCAPLMHQAIGSAARGGTTRLSFGPFVSARDVNVATQALAEIAGSIAHGAVSCDQQKIS